MAAQKTDLTEGPASDLIEITVSGAPGDQIVYGRDKDGKSGIRATGGQTVFVSQADLDNHPTIGNPTKEAKPLAHMATATPAPAPAPVPVPAPMPKPAEASK